MAEVKISDSTADNLWNFMGGYKQGYLFKKESVDNGAAEIFAEGALPFVVLVPELQPGTERTLTFLVSTGVYCAEISFKKHVKQRKNTLGMAVEDMYGEFSYSTFNMRIISNNAMDNPLDRTIKDGDGFIVQEILDIAVSLIKHFLDVYRHAWSLEAYKHTEELMKSKCNKAWIPEIDYKRLSPWTNIKIRNKNGKVLLEQPHIDYRGTGVGLGFDLTVSGLNHLQELCVRDYDEGIDGYIRIINRHFIRHDYEAGCILLASTLEKYVFMRLEEKLAANGKTAEQIESETTTNRRDGSKKTINIDKALTLYFGNDQYKSTVEWLDCDTYLREVRHQIVHGDIAHITKAQAKKMIQVYSGFISYMKSESMGSDPFCAYLMKSALGTLLV